MIITIIITILKMKSGDPGINNNNANETTKNPISIPTIKVIKMITITAALITIKKLIKTNFSFFLLL